MIPHPTPLEIASAADRAEIAKRSRAEIDAAIEACGPGAIAYGKWVISDKRKHDPLPPRVIYCCRRKEHLGLLPRYDDSEERLSPEDHPGYEFHGIRLYPFRFAVSFSALTTYEPDTAQQLANRRAKRAGERVESLRREQRNLLFPEVMDSEISRHESLMR